MEKSYDFVYRDTVDFINCIIEDYGFYGDLINIMKTGNGKISMHRKQLQKQIDENWVLAIEQSLNSLDNAIRNPMKDLKESEDVLPIELSRNITSRSIRHLAQHTDYINSIEGDKITPSKILNVYKDETQETYENKFIVTLIDRLFHFIEIRYKKLVEYGNDEACNLMEFETQLESDKSVANLKFSIEVKTSLEKTEEDEALTSSTLWERVERLRNIATAYMNSEISKKLQGKFIRPPVIRTNAITKIKTCDNA